MLSNDRLPIKRFLLLWLRCWVTILNCKGSISAFTAKLKIVGCMSYLRTCWKINSLNERQYSFSILNIAMKHKGALVFPGISHSVWVGSWKTQPLDLVDKLHPLALQISFNLENEIRKVNVSSKTIMHHRWFQAISKTQIKICRREYRVNSWNPPPHTHKKVVLMLFGYLSAIITSDTQWFTITVSLYTLKLMRFSNHLWKRKHCWKFILTVNVTFRF